MAICNRQVLGVILPILASSASKENDVIRDSKIMNVTIVIVSPSNYFKSNVVCFGPMAGNAIDN